jgi:hypothetical protein
MDIQWPAIIKNESHCELVYLKNAQSLAQFIESAYLPMTKKDYLIDSTGHQFTIEQVQSALTFILIKTCDIEFLNELLKAHFSDAGQCCITKLYVTNYQDAIEAVRLLEE